MKPSPRKRLTTLTRLQPYGIQRALWLAVVSTVILSGVMAIGAIDPETHEFEVGAHVPYMIGANLLMFIVLYLYNFRIMRGGLHGGALMATSLGGSLVLTALFSIPTWYLEGALLGSQFNNMMVTMAVNGTTGLIASLISILLHNVTLHQLTLLENEHLQTENLRIHHKTLEQQVSPHFLFNSLNALDALIGTDNAGAHRYLQQLAAIYRYVLQQREVVTLREELEFTHAYAELMRTRYGEQALLVEEHIDDTQLERQVPPISLQLLVENAIKHNVITPRHPLTVTIASTPSHGLIVSNPLKPKDGSHPESGLGLTNLSQRYRLLGGGDITIRNDGTTFSVEMPLLEQRELRIEN